MGFVGDVGDINCIGQGDRLLVFLSARVDSVKSIVSCMHNDVLSNQQK